jgi:hypothetical protein
MDLSKLQKTLQKCKELSKETTNDITNISLNIINNNNIDEDEKEESYTTFSDKERIYHKNNQKYKQIISQLSPAYLSMSDFYVGSDLPRDYETTFLDSKQDIEQLYALGLFYGMASMFMSEIK